MSSSPYYSDDHTDIYHADCISLLTRFEAGTYDAVVTDPPYGLEFMGKDWDSFGRDTGNGYQEKPRMNNGEGLGGYRERPNYYTAGRPFQAWCETWAAECLRVLKPGGYLLAFGGTRTSHRLACAIEDAGFEIRDSIAWLHGQGFPKGKVQLKPAHEPIIVARRPGKSVLNIDACRVGAGGRWPANAVLDEQQAAELDQQSGVLTSGANPTRRSSDKFRDVFNEFPGHECNAIRGADSGGASRFFFIAREDEPCGPSDVGNLSTDTTGSTDRDRSAAGASLSAAPVESGISTRFRYVAKADSNERPRVNGIAHPTVKPLSLMRWLVRLVAPPGGLVLDPFAGSGTTVEACRLEGMDCTAIEREADYLPLIQARLQQGVLDFSGEPA